MRILVIEDDAHLRLALKERLESENFSVETAEDGAAGSLLGRTNDYDLILLDLMLPERLGSLVCTEVRSAGKAAPILMMATQADVPKKVELLNLGADDYLPKPFSFDELMARIHALLRRPPALKTTILRHKHLTLDTARHQVLWRNRPIHLTRKEFSLLEYLMRHEGAVVTRHMLLEQVWDGALDIFTNTIETHIRSLRKKLASKGCPACIQTISGRGYIFDSDRKL